MEYALYWLEKQEKYTPEIFIMLCAHSPLGTLKILNKVIEAFFNDDKATEARTFYRAPHYPWMENSSIGRLVPMFDVTPLDRQLFPRMYNLGPYAIYGHPRIASSQGRRTSAVYIEPEEGLEVHTEEDLFLARCYMERRLKKKGGGK